MKQNNGFTVIELLIEIAIMFFIGAFVFYVVIKPSYQEHSSEIGSYDMACRTSFARERNLLIERVKCADYYVVHETDCSCAEIKVIKGKVVTPNLVIPEETMTDWENGLEFNVVQPIHE